MTGNLADPNSDERKLQAVQRLEEGINQYQNSNFDAALNLYQQAHEIYQELGDKDGVWRTLNNIGLVYSSLKQQEQALIFLQQALEICRELSYRLDEADILDNIGWVYENLSQKFKSDAKAIRDQFNGYIQPATSDTPIIKPPRK